MGPKGFSEISIRNYHYSLRNSPEERSFHLESKPLTTAPRCEFQVSFLNGSVSYENGGHTDPS